ncbi:MAG: pyridoxal phosphate-dependent aminotransferase [Candidatus Marinimicrobia bacterium]|jgi:aspartate aminotransferase|nr:pyridoxal phosphate-dependent aminotransferase [Candidatus Neomarinimicrobiota bacterium]MBT3945552.1 pyridoxal phosphate-dependent aminotransferase [Candidatus Neomarinimicrobiota bacterium]MBT4154160.1 pyridoxal phosphate-dependent aminotransferase [Candidatus Neomarinimicrobiota bacterium]MBT4554231.1 pyridoxal phosphate-dependent aminotransferase [Candidatus Neomarinimicrobiota bacterium]MBT4752788.1 pyridoxal phosphate-dependent aminotransferase [Candidatus Neomarinimicrobiota bacterium|tara:strand:- start:14668 stop:15813 length:1146 start_codon:yes stop_codon:yes gene_type:complete
MATKAAEMKAEGIDVINFSVGEPDFNTPSHIIAAGQKAMDDGFTKYTAGPGMIEFRKAICEKLKRENGITYEPADILVSNGEKQSLYNVCQALFDTGDEVVVFRPYWVSFPEFVRLADAEPVLVDTVAENNFEPDFDDLSNKITSNIKGVILNSPSNPTGGIWGEDAIVKLLRIAKENNWVVISDECYERLVYDGEFVSTEKLNRQHKIGAVVITCLSLSKTYAMTGWRIGYAAGPRDIIKAMAKIQGQATSCANSIGQKAGIEALTGDQSCVDNMKTAFRERRDFIIQLLNDLPGISCAVPGGAFYAFPDFSSYLGRLGNGNLLKDTFDISEYILGCVNVVTVPGDGFGAPGHIRFSYATSKEIIQKGIDRVRSALENIA